MNEKNITFSIKGMTCASCVNRVENNIKKIDGIKYVSVNLATEKAFVTVEKGLEFETIESAVKNAGYEASKDIPTENELEKRFIEKRKNLKITLIVTLPLVFLMILHMIGIMIPFFVFIELIVAGFVLFYNGRETLKGAWIALSHFHTNMDTLISLGALSAWLTSLMNILGMDIFSFGSLAAMILAFHITGRYIEARLKQKASKEIRSLLSMKVSNANVLDKNNNIKVVPVETVKKEALVLVRTGEKVPLDGIIIEGKANIDESMVSGEPIPVNKKIGDEVIGGTVVNSGLIKFKVEKVGEDTFLNQMIKLIEEAQSSKVPIQALADKITKIFIPTVFSLALISAVIWFFNYDSFLPFLERTSDILPWINPYKGNLSTAVFVFVSSLVIACPCALGLATPMALVTGSGVAAKKGLIIKSGEAIQLAKDLDVLLLDKTGTITEGKPKVIETNIPQNEYNIIASIEDNSVHPLAKSIVEKAKSDFYFNKLKITDIEEISGQGVKGIYNNNEYFVGKPQKKDDYGDLMSRGYTLVEARKNNQIIGYIAISDPIKEDSIKAIKQIKKAGITPIMVTGDNHITAKKVAFEVGIDEYIAGVKPEEKVKIVRENQYKGLKTGMVGDGINDAAALKSADIGIAIGTGTDLAIESADIVIIKGELSKVFDSINISKITFKKIKQNLFFAFMYNIIAIPLAMTGLLHPLIAEIAMIFSSINVILNSSRIRKKA